MRCDFRGHQVQLSNRAMALILAGAVVLGPGDLRADWPMARHDLKRSGAAKGKSNISKPAVHWRYYLGGELKPQQVAFLDVDKDGKKEVVFMAGGRLVAKRPDDTPIWEAPTKDLRSLWGVADLDGDGVPDVIGSTRDRAYVLSSVTGKVQWAEPEGEMGVLGYVRLADLDGDGLAELVVAECVCCSGSSKNTGYVYSFAQGFGKATLLWKLPFAACGGGRSMVLADLDGAAPAELALANNASFSILDGKTGAVLAKAADFGSYIQMSDCRGVDLDSKPGQEIVCAHNFALATKERRKVFALQYQAKPTPTLKLLWKKTVAPDTGGDVSFAELVADLDGDGKPELMVSGKDATAWTTWVLDGMTGKQLAQVKGQRVAGSAPLEHKTQRLLLTDANNTLTAWAYAPGGSPALSKRWSLAKLQVQLQPDQALAGRGSIAARLATVDLDGDGLQDLVVTSLAEPGKLYVYSGKGGSNKLLASHSYPKGTRALAAWAIEPVTTSYAQIAAVRYDGELVLYDKQLNATPALGIRVGGFYASGAWRQFSRAPRLAALGQTKVDAIIVSDSRSALLRLDAEKATLAAPPVKVWEQTSAFAPSIIQGLDQAASGARPGVACLGLVEPVTAPPQYRVLALKADGSSLWSQPLTHTPFNDLLFGKLDKDGIPDLIYQWGDNADTKLQTRALSGSDGKTLWSAAPLDLKGGRNPAGITVADWDKDGTADVLFQGAQTRVLSGADGKQLAQGGPAGATYMITLADLDGDGTDEAIYHGGSGKIRVYKKDLTTLIWQSADDDLPFPYAALARCPAGLVLVGASVKHTALLKVTPLSGAKLGKYSTLILAGGKTYAANAAAKAAGAVPGQLTSVNVHADLTGKGRPTAVMGSTHGWLYAVDPCAAKLDFAVKFPSAVGESVFGDTDGDGLDEVVVSVADGFLYALKQEALAKPAYVWDTDPVKGITSDVDTIETTDQLSASWAPVKEAKGYEVAVLEYRGGIISSPAWRSVGSKTEASVSKLPLKHGKKYLFAVRAVGPSGARSADALSDGVVVTLPGHGGDASTKDMGTGDGSARQCPPVQSCSCDATSGGRGGLWLVLLLGGMLLWSRRRLGVR